MSLFRLAIVLSCGVALMPSDQEQQQQLYQKAASAAYWTATFCDRNEKTCDTAGMLWDTFLSKAQFAGRLGYDLAQHYYLNPSTQPASLATPPPTAGAAKIEKISAAEPVVAETAKPAPAAADAPVVSQGTLQPQDLAPAWRGKQQGGA